MSSPVDIIQALDAENQQTAFVTWLREQNCQCFQDLDNVWERIVNPQWMLWLLGATATQEIWLRIITLGILREAMVFADEYSDICEKALEECKNFYLYQDKRSAFSTAETRSSDVQAEYDKFLARAQPPVNKAWLAATLTGCRRTTCQCLQSFVRAMDFDPLATVLAVSKAALAVVPPQVQSKIIREICQAPGILGREDPFSIDITIEDTEEFLNEP